jgi:hypothetical protein
VIRGGAWTDEPSGCRAVRRDGRNPNYDYSNAPSSYRGYLGFRVARVPISAPSPEAKTPPEGREAKKFAEEVFSGRDETNAVWSGTEVARVEFE